MNPRIKSLFRCICLLIFGWSSFSLGSEPKLQSGKALFEHYQCNACHYTDGTRSVGPPLNGLYGKKIKLSSGRTIKADQEYIRTSILDPTKDVVEGFPPAMPSYKHIHTEELEKIVKYILSLR